MKNQSNDNGNKAKPDEIIKTCFVIMPIADVLPTYSTGHFNRVYEYIIKPACKTAGFSPIRADDVKSSNLIMVDILEKILNADMAICDQSARNPNVMYELALRQAFDMPVSIIKDDITSDIFDVQGIRYVPYDSHMRIDLVNETVNLLAENILDTYNNRDKSVFSLVQLLGRQKAKTKISELPSETITILDAISELRSLISKTNSTVSLSSSTDNSKIPPGVVNAIFPNPDTVVMQLANKDIKIGMPVFHNDYGIGWLKGLGSLQGTGVFIIDFMHSGSRAVRSDELQFEVDPLKLL